MKKKTKLRLNNYSDTFKINFVKESSSVYSAGLAVDDLEFHGCAVGDAEAECDDPTEYFHCQFSRVCIPRYKV